MGEQKMITFPIHYPLCCACYKPAHDIGAEYRLIHARRVICQACTTVEGWQFSSIGAVVQREVEG